MNSTIYLVAIAVVAAVGASTLIFAVPVTGGLNYTQNPFEPQPTGTIGTGISFAVVGYDLQGLTDQAELIIDGKVMDKKNAGKQGVSTPGVPDELTHLPVVNNLVQVQKVLKGEYPDKTINVLTEGDLTGQIQVEDSVKLANNEHVVLFLLREPIYDNQWTVVGMEQGHFKVDKDGNIVGHTAGNGNIKEKQLGFEKKIRVVSDEQQPQQQQQELERRAQQNNNNTD